MSTWTPTASLAAAEPLRLEDLVAPFREAGKPRSRWRVGAEFEKFALDPATGRQVSYQEPGGVRDMLADLAERFGWRPQFEAGHLTGLVRDGASISLEPGAQVELSIPPVATLAEVDDHLGRHLAELAAVGPDWVWAACGVTPVSDVRDIPLVPRRRYSIMDRYLPKQSPMGPAMMRATASTQVAFDYADEEDAVRKFSVALRAGPLANALWANSPLLAERRAEPSVRGLVWEGMDPDRSGLLIPLLQRGLSFESWIDYLLDVPMMFFFENGEYRPSGGATFRRFLEIGHDGRPATVEDWDIHLTTVFPEARLKRYLEIRGADATDAPLAVGIAAFWKGLLYDDGALGQAEALLAEIPLGDLPAAQRAANRQGLRAEVAGRSVGAWAAELVALAGAGLAAQGEESRWLDPVREIVAAGRSPAEQYLATYAEPPSPPLLARWFAYRGPFPEVRPIACSAVVAPKPASRGEAGHASPLLRTLAHHPAAAALLQLWETQWTAAVREFGADGAARLVQAVAPRGTLWVLAESRRTAGRDDARGEISAWEEFARRLAFARGRIESHAEPDPERLLLVSALAATTWAAAQIETALAIDPDPLLQAFAPPDDGPTL